MDHAKRLTVQQAIAHPWLGKTPEELAKFSLDSNLATLRKFQATRKLRAAVHTVIAANRMKVSDGDVLVEVLCGVVRCCVVVCVSVVCVSVVCVLLCVQIVEMYIYTQ